MKIESGYLDVNGARLYVEQAGSGQAVVLIHGFSLDCRMWDDQFEGLARRCRAVRYDLRGFGRSELPTSMPYAHAADLLALLDRLGIPRAHLVGLSLGGAIALGFATLSPFRLGKLVLVDSALGGYPMSAEYQASFEPIRAAAIRGDVAAARRLWLAHPLFAPAQAKERCAESVRRIISAYSGWHWSHRDPDQGAGFEVIDCLGAIRAPALVVVGERDLPDFQAVAGRLYREIPTARKVVLPGAGHLANLEAPEEFNLLLLDFLGF